MTPVRLELAALRSRVKHSTTEPLRSLTNHAVFILSVLCKTTTVCKRISLVTGGKHFSKTFSIFYMLNSKNRVFSLNFFNCYLSNGKTAFVDNSRVKATIFFIEKIS